MDLQTCSDINKEQLYMFEFLIDHIDLTADTIKRIGSSPITVRLKFIDFPVFDLNQEEFSHAKKKAQATTKLKNDKPKSGSVDFSMGKTCLFPKKPNDLVQAMRSETLKIGIFLVPEKNACDAEKEDAPVCEAKVLLSGCLCDQVTMAMNDKNHLPKPYVLKNTYNLIDDQGNPSGTITLFLRLSCFGKLIVTQFALQDKSFLFKSSQSPNEFQCTKITTEPETDQEEICKSVLEQKVDDRSLKPQNVIGLSSICQELAKRDGRPPDLITIPAKITPRQEIKELYRKKSETIFEEDPLCICPDDGNYLKVSTKNQPCGGVGCAGGLCVGTRLLDSLPRDHHGASSKSPCYTGSCCTGGVEDCCKLFRLRGGGCCKDNGSDSARSKTQSKGIIDNPIFMNFSSRKDLPGNQSMETLVSGACKSSWKDTATPDRTGCGCFGKKERGLNSGGTCSKNPCMGIDCLIRKFTEVQEFVDSVGKIPGLAGLGLMDPSESPYFGRGKETGNTCEQKNKITSKNQNEVQSSGVLNANSLTAKNFQTKEKKSSEIKPKYEVANSSPYASTQAAVPVVPNRPVREISNVQNEKLVPIIGKSKRKEEKSEKLVHGTSKSKHELQVMETGPCKEPKCKSKKKKGKEEVSSAINTDLKKTFSFGARNALEMNENIIGERKDKGQSKRKTLSKHFGSSGERVPSNSFVKVSKNVLRHIYSMGKRNPGIVFGHKNCLDLRMRVPKNMGWLWNSREIVGRKPPRLGWKPGAISKYVYELLQEAKANSGSSVESRPSTPIKGKKGKTIKIKSFQSLGRLQRTKKEDKNQEIELPPTLHIHRKDGTYYITMYPLNQESAENPEVQEQVKPLQFKVTKNKDDASNCSSSTASDMEIEFSPPAAINRFHKKPEVKSIDIQVKQQDILDAFKSSTGKPPKTKKEKKKK